MADPTDRNRLDDAASPYLRQHADNPVHWQPWDDAALDAARERGVPLFLSIGYSSCHWCHVMEEESFSDPEVAEVLNENYVPIKVDREERPDLDALYISVCQLLGSNCGWPLNVWCTPDGKPFYVDTYLPPEGRGDQQSFREVLTERAEEWAEEQGTLIERGRTLLDAVDSELGTIPDLPDEPPADDYLEDAAGDLFSRVDRDYGGFGGSPKFPGPRRLQLLLRAGDRTGREEFTDAVCATLDAMAAGGIHDHVGGGFHRYATDATWNVPHFEKMLYDNAEIPRVYLDAYRATGEAKYADVVHKTLSFVDHDLGHPDGGFYSTLDARSPPPMDRGGDPEEGAYYTWKQEEIFQLVADEERANIFCDRYGITGSGNVGDAHTLNLSADVETLAETYEMDAETVQRELRAAMEAIADHRETRPEPARDEKVIAGWNGLAVSAFAEAGLTLGPEYADRAVRALDFLRERLWNAEERRLARRYKDGDTSVDGFLEDYAFVARGALDCYQATGDVEHLAFALDVARGLVERFWDEESGALYFTPVDDESLGARPQHLDDQSTPSAVAVGAETLLALDAFAPDEAFGEVGGSVVDRFADRAAEDPYGLASMAAAVDTRRVGHLELTVAADDLPSEWGAAVGERYLPDRVLSVRPPTEDDLSAWLDRLGLEEAPPVWAGRDAADGPTAYVCRRACSPPLTDLEDIEEWVAEFAPQ